jgi:hypothetical protein
MAAQLTRMPKHLSEVRPDVPTAFSALVMKMLAKNPDDRPSDARSALDELDAIATPTGIVAPSPLATTRARRWGVAVGVGLAGLAAIALAMRMRDRTRVDLPPAAVASRTTDSARANAMVGASAKAPVAARSTTGMAGAGGTKTTTKVATKADTKAATKPLSSAPRPKAAAPAPVFAAPRRVAIMPFRVSTNRPNITAAMQSMQDSLRKAVTAAGFTLATDSELLRMVTQQSMPGGMRRAASDATVGAVVMMDVVARGDEVQAITQVLDVWRNQTSAGRQSADIDRPAELTVAIRDVLRSLDRVSWRSATDPKRVLMFGVENMSGISAIDTVARVVEDSLRAAVARAGLSTLPIDSAARATRDVNERRMLGIRRGAGAIVATSIYRHRIDSVLVRLSVRDMSEEVTFPNIDVRVPARDVAAAVDALTTRFAELLGRVNWGPKATPSQ